MIVAVAVLSIVASGTLLAGLACLVSAEGRDRAGARVADLI
ncbi:hypothetical protein [Methylobacterium marchantiae]|uniref:Uncharacterized protein n=1 Tax=Methylobacterium marchantiae TaxID=600331 RepID=A0ABW3X068_9HYPH|nr:hypothetical protein AIGOOFII_2216 [Methylobacterium marchantiae]